MPGCKSKHAFVESFVTGTARACQEQTKFLTAVKVSNDQATGRQVFSYKFVLFRFGHEICAGPFTEETFC
jgi:hypothetical protein